MQQILSLLQHNKWQLIALIIGAISVFVFQSNNYGFEQGHLGWVSSHVLAQSEKATVENGYLGYALQEMDEAGNIDKFYFDRYPIFFSAISRSFRHFFSNELSGQILAGRSLMNIIFVLTLGICFFISQLITDKNRALQATLLVFSGSTLLFYKEMLHFDQPAILGQSLLILAIGGYLLRNWSTWWIYLATMIGVSLGRGYASMFTLATWGLLELYSTYKGTYANTGSTSRSYKDYFFHPAIKAGFLGLSICIVALSYNIYTEARVRNVSIEKTSIVISAKARTGLSHEPRMQESITASKVFGKLFNRTLYGLVPFALKPTLPQSNSAGGILTMLILIFGLGYGVRARYKIAKLEKTNNTPQTSLASKKIFILLLLSAGAFWLIFMKRLFVFHDYTIMYMLFFNLAFYVFILKWLPDRILKMSSILSLIIFISSLALVQLQIDKSRSLTEPVTDDFSQIKNILEKSNTTIVGLEEGRYTFLPGLPYVLGFYLPKQTLAPASQCSAAANSSCNKILTKNKNFSGTNLTPNNQTVFLFLQGTY